MKQKLLFAKRMPGGNYIEFKGYCKGCGVEMSGFYLEGYAEDISVYCEECNPHDYDGDIIDMIVLEDEIIGIVEVKGNEPIQE